MIGDKIKLLRIENNLSQARLGSLLNVSQQAIGSWESKKTEPDIDNLKKLAEIFNIDLHYLLETTSANKDSLPKRIKILIEKFELLDDKGKTQVEYTLDREIERINIAKKEEEFELLQEKIKNLEKSKTPDALKNLLSKVEDTLQEVSTLDHSNLIAAYNADEVDEKEYEKDLEMMREIAKEIKEKKK